MAAKTKRSPKKTGGGSSATSWFHSSRGALALSGALLLLTTLLPYATPSREREGPYLVDASCVERLLGPRWLEPSTEEAIRESMARLGQVSLRDDAALEEFLAQLSTSSPWIERVHSARKEYPDGLEVEVDLREPVARVVGEWQGQSVESLVDPSGVVLGPSSEAPELIRARRLPRLLRPGGPRVFERGRVIEDAPLRQAIAVAQELAPFRQTLGDRGVHVALVDVTPLVTGRSARLSDVDLYTAEGLCIQWGRACSTPVLGAVEPRPEVKVAHIKEALAKYPGFQGIRTLRVQFEDHFSVEMERAGAVITDSYRPAE